MERRTGGLTDEELEGIAAKIHAKMPLTEGCRLTEAQQEAVVEFLAAKKRVVRWTLYVLGLLLIWIVKDIYYFISSHLSWLQTK